MGVLDGAPGKHWRHCQKMDGDVGQGDAGWRAAEWNHGVGGGQGEVQVRWRSRAGRAGWESSDGDTGWGHQMGTWQRGTPPGNGWMEMLGEDASSFLPPFTIFFIFLAENNPRMLSPLPPLATGSYIQMGSIQWILRHFYNLKSSY